MPPPLPNTQILPLTRLRHLKVFILRTRYLIIRSLATLLEKFLRHGICAVCFCALDVLQELLYVACRWLRCVLSASWRSGWLDGGRWCRIWAADSDGDALSGCEFAASKGRLRKLCDSVQLRTFSIECSWLLRRHLRNKATYCAGRTLKRP